MNLAPVSTRLAAAALLALSLGACASLDGKGPDPDRYYMDDGSPRAQRRVVEGTALASQPSRDFDFTI